MPPAPYQISAVHNFLHVALQPGFRLALDELGALWRDIRAACSTRGLRHVLIEGEQAVRHLAPDDVPQHAALISGHDSPLRVAYCLYDYPADHLTRQFVADANRGRSSVQVFDQLDPALRWLGA